jgi:hypothetical protein
MPNQPTFTTALPLLTPVGKIRQTAIDYLKAFLVIGMILGHSLQLLSKPKGLLWAFSTGINLITFSGFFFCFGYVFYWAYLTKPFIAVRGKIVRTAIKTLVGYYVAALTSLLILSPQFSGRPYIVSVNALLEVIYFKQVPAFTEFLLTFFLITALVGLFFRFFRTVAHSWLFTLLVSGIGWITAAILPVDLNLGAPLSLFIGTQTHFVFPLIQYLPVFLLGLSFACRNLIWHPVIGSLALFGTSLFIGYYLYYGQEPRESSPSIFWLLGSYGILYMYFLLAKWLERQSFTLPYLLSVGQNTLFYLITSNLIIFSLRRNLQVESLTALLIGLLVIGVIGFLISLVQATPKH